MSSPIITLTTDFGARDWYVGAVKGALLGVNPSATVVDISHDIPPQDTAHGAFVLGSVYRSFPADAVHVAVVDPGVGTSRRALLVVIPEGRFIAPDNGLLTYVLADHRTPTSETLSADSLGKFMQPTTAPVPDGCSAYSLTRAEYWHHPVGDTFHGRDVFAPVAAHLSLGVRPEQLGESVEEVVHLNIHAPTKRNDAVEGRIIFVDHFGNLVSNIRSSLFPSGSIQVEIAGNLIDGLSRSFAESEGLLALVGSHGYLEVAERNGSAAGRLGAKVGTELRAVVGH